MRRLGKALYLLKNGLLVVKLQDPSPPSIGSSVLTKEGEAVGVVHDVIGRVSSPYVVVKLLKELQRRSLAELYVEDRRG